VSRIAAARLGFLSLLFLTVVATPAFALQHAEGALEMAKQLPLISVLPFVLMLLSIAVLPLFAEHWWEHNRNKAIVAAVCALPILIYLGIAWGPEGRLVLEDKMIEYIAFSGSRTRAARIKRVVLNNMTISLVENPDFLWV